MSSRVIERKQMTAQGQLLSHNCPGFSTEKINISSQFAFEAQDVVSQGYEITRN